MLQISDAYMVVAQSSFYIGMSRQFHSQGYVSPLIELVRGKALVKHIFLFNLCNLFRFTVFIFLIVVNQLSSRILFFAVV